MAAYLPRVIDEVLRQRLRSAGAVVLEGPKACGKTLTAEQVAASRVYLDIDTAAQQALEVDPALVLSRDPPQLVDEWQVDATRVWNFVRSQINRRQAPGQFVLTGSSVPVEDPRRHTGAGRFSRLTMRPMSLFESGDSTGAMSLAALLSGDRPSSPESSLAIGDVADLVVRGGWPLNLSMSLTDAARANVDYLRVIAEVDIPRVDEARRDPATARRLLQALARNVGMEKKVARLVRDVDGEAPARTTAYDYLSALTRLLIFEEQPPWATHLRSRATMRTAARVHLVDPSLAAAALAAGPARLLADLNFLGLLFESLVVRDFRVFSEPLDATVHHYRDSDGLEVDIIVQCRDGSWGAFEVKLGAGHVDRAAANLRTFADKVDPAKVGPPAVLGVVTATGYGYTRPDGVVVAPAGALGP